MVFYNRPIHGFFQLLTWTRKEKSVNSARESVFKSVKTTKFESNLLKTNKDVGPQSPKILQTFQSGDVCLYIFARLRRITFKLGNWSNFKAFFLVVPSELTELLCQTYTITCLIHFAWKTENSLPNHNLCWLCILFAINQWTRQTTKMTHWYSEVS